MISDGPPLQTIATFKVATSKYAKYQLQMQNQASEPEVLIVSAVRWNPCEITSLKTDQGYPPHHCSIKYVEKIQSRIGFLLHIFSQIR